MTTAQRTVSAAGLLTGLALAALLVITTHVPASSRPLGAGVRVMAAPAGELRVERGRVVLADRGLLAGDAARGSLRLRNTTGGEALVRFSARLSRRDLDRLLMVSLRAGGRTLAAGPLAELRRPSRPLRIPRGGVRTLEARAWLEPASSGYEGRFARVRLRMQVRVPR